MSRRSRKQDAANLGSRRRARAQNPRTLQAYQDARKGFIMIGISVFIVGAMGLFAILRPTIELDQNNCIIGQAIPGHTVFLIDGTDKIDGSYLARLEEDILSKRDKLPVGEKLTVVRLSGNEMGEPEFKELFSKCNPGQGTQFAGITESKKKKQAEWSLFFGKQLSEAMIELSQLKVGDSSPIIESINELTFKDDFSNDQEGRKLILVSDLMQHTDELSHYRVGNYSYSGYQKLGEPYSNVSLTDMTVEVTYIKRSKLKNYQSKVHKEFWDAYFIENGANVEKFR